MKNEQRVRHDDGCAGMEHRRRYRITRDHTTVYAVCRSCGASGVYPRVVSLPITDDGGPYLLGFRLWPDDRTYPRWVNPYASVGGSLCGSVITGRWYVSVNVLGNLWAGLLPIV